MKSKIFILIFIFGLFLFLLLPNVAEGACPMDCYPCDFIGASSVCQDSTDCLYQDYGGVERLGIIGTVGNSNQGTPGFIGSCEDTEGKCNTDRFSSGYNGQTCTARDNCIGTLYCLNKTRLAISGVWDAAESQCVTCNGKFENRILGDTTSVFAGCGSENGNAGDGKCESACGASSYCDEKNSSAYTGGCSYGNPLRKDYCNSSCSMSDEGCSSSCGSIHSKCEGKEPGESCGAGGTCTNSCQCVGEGECGDGTCEGDETYSNCWQDCCDSDCTATYDSTCHSACNNYNNCDLTLGCDGKVSGSTICDVTGEYEATCCEGSFIDCGTEGDQCCNSNCGYQSVDYGCSGGSCWGPTLGTCNDCGDYTCSAGSCTQTCSEACGAECDEGSDCLSGNCKSDCTCEAEEDECTSGVCCDTSSHPYTYRPSSYVCDGQYATDYSCPWGTDCGDDVGVRYRERYCSGNSSACSGTISDWGSYTIYDNCLSTETCTDNDKTCNYTPSCTVACDGDLTVSISGEGSCSVTASLSASNCSGQSWAVKDNGNTKCSGPVLGTPYSRTCSSWTVGVDSYTYNLYIDRVFKDNGSVTCSEEPSFDFSISIDPTSGSTEQGNSISTNVGVIKTSGDAQTVTLLYSSEDIVTRVPFSDVGITFSFTPDNNCVPDDSCSRTLTISTSVTTSLNTYYILISGIGDGASDSETYTLTVTEVVEEIIPPEVTTGDATNLTKTSATLSGILNSMGNVDSALVWFEWGPTTSYGNSTTPVEMTSPGLFSANIAGLNPDTTYYFEAKAKNGGSW